MSEPVAAPRTSVGLIFLVLFLDLVGFSILFPLYADMLHYYGAQPGGLLAHAMGAVHRMWPTAQPQQEEALFGGLLGAGYSLLQFVCAPWWGRLSDRFGRRPILLLSVTGSCLAYALWIVAGSFAVLLLSRLIAGLMGGAAACANAAVADVTATPRERAKGMGFVGMAFGLGFILGPLIGAASYAAFKDVGRAAEAGAGLAAHGWTPFSGTACVAFSLSAINLAWAALRFRETLPPERRQATPGAQTRTANPLRLFSRALGHGVMRVNGAFFLHTLLFAGMETTLVFLTSQALGFTAKQNGPLFAWMGFLAALVQGGIFRRLAPKIGGKPLAVAGFIVLIPGFLVLAALAMHPAKALLWAGVTVLALATGLVFPSLNTLVSLATDERNQGLALGTFRSAGSLGRAVGPLAAASLYFWWPAAPYLVGAVGVVLPLLLIARLKPYVHAPAGAA